MQYLRSNDLAGFAYQLHRYLAARRTTFDGFFENFRPKHDGKLTHEQFRKLMTKVMATLKIDSMNVLSLFDDLKAENGLIDLVAFKDRYCDLIGVHQIQSKSIEENRKSIPKDINRSIEKRRDAEQQDREMSKAELGLDYLIGSPTVQQKLKRSLIDKNGNYRLTIEGVSQFIQYCNLRQLSNSHTKDKIIEKIFRILKDQTPHKNHRKFYREALAIARALAQATSSNINMASRNNIDRKTKYFIDDFSQIIKSSAQSVMLKSMVEDQPASQLLAEKESSRYKGMRSTSLKKTFQKPRIKGIASTDQPVAFRSFIHNQGQLIRLARSLQDEKCHRLRQSVERLNAMKQHELAIEDKCAAIVEEYGDRNLHRKAGQFTTASSLEKKQRNKGISSKENSYRPSTRNIGYISTRIQKHPISAKVEKNQPRASLKVDFRTKYPLASKYYRLNRIPSQHELPFFAELDTLLRKRAVFTDKYNPSTKYEYRTAKQLLNCSKYSVIEATTKNLDANRVRKGKKGSCNLFALLGCLADKFPQYVSDKLIFEANPARYYCVKVYIDGEETIIKTDDRFPSKYQQPVFAAPPLHQIWTMLIQKAYAKVFNGYDNICNAPLEEAFAFLTGKTAVSSHINSAPAQLDLEAMMKNKTCSLILGYTQPVSSAVRNKLQLREGIRSSQAYSILDIKANAKDIVIVKGRNPSGVSYLSQQTALQQDSLLKGEDLVKIKADLLNGCFYLAWEDFCKYFPRIQSFHFNPAFKLSSFRVQVSARSNESIQKVTMKIPKKGFYRISIIQPSLRRMSCHYPQLAYNYAQCLLRVSFRKSTVEPQCIFKAKSQDQQCLSVGHEFNEGIFSLEIEFSCLQHKSLISCLAIQGPQPVSCQFLAQYTSQLSINQ